MDDFMKNSASWLKTWQDSQEQLGRQYQEWEQQFKSQAASEKQKVEDAGEKIAAQWAKAQSDLTEHLMGMGKKYQKEFVGQFGEKQQSEIFNSMGMNIFQEIFKQWINSSSTANSFPGADMFSGFGGNQNSFMWDFYQKNSPFKMFGQSENIMGDFQKNFENSYEYLKGFNAPLAEMSKNFAENLNSFGKSGLDGNRESFESYLSEFELKFRKLLTSQKLGVDREITQKICDGILLFLDYAKSRGKISQLIMNASTKSSESISQKLIAMAKEGSTPGFKELIKLWTSETEGVFMELLDNPEYAKLQGECTGAYYKYKTISNQIAETSLRESPFAMKSDLDLTIGEIHKFKGDLKGLKRELIDSRKEISALKEEINTLKKDKATPNEAPKVQAKKATKAPAKKSGTVKKSGKKAK